MITALETDDYLTVAEVAALLKSTEAAVRVAISDGRLPAKFEYNRRWILREDAEAYRNRTQPGGVKPTGRPKLSKDRVKRGASKQEGASE